MNEMLDVSSYDELLVFVQSFASDLRRILVTLQFLSQSSSITNVDKSSMNMPSTTDRLQLQWPSSSMFDAMYYSNLSEQWRSSSLKSMFDVLTRQYRHDYKQSYHTLISMNRNQSTRSNNMCKRTCYSSMIDSSF
jgi:hypothetical protein